MRIEDLEEAQDLEEPEGGETGGHRVLQVLQAAFYRGNLHISDCYKGATGVLQRATNGRGIIGGEF